MVHIAKSLVFALAASAVALKAAKEDQPMTKFEMGCYMKEDPTGETGGAKVRARQVEVEVARGG